MLKESHLLSAKLCVVPIVLGVMLVTSNGSSGSVTFLGFITAIISTLFGNINSVYTKVLLRHDSFSAKELNCFVAWICFVLSVPALFLFEDFRAMYGSLSTECTLWGFTMPCDAMLFVNAFCYFSQSILGFLLLSRISYLTFSVIGTVKRVFVVLMAVLVMQSPVSWIQGFGVALAMSGTALYSLWPRRKELLRTRSMASLIPLFNQAQRD